jgi:predicted nucleotidyltransferase
MKILSLVKTVIEHCYIGVNVLLVGSFACGTSLPDSDLDVTVVVPPDQLMAAGGEEVRMDIG